MTPHIRTHFFPMYNGKGLARFRAQPRGTPKTRPRSPSAARRPADDPKWPCPCSDRCAGCDSARSSASRTRSRHARSASSGRVKKHVGARNQRRPTSMPAARDDFGGLQGRSEVPPELSAALCALSLHLCSSSGRAPRVKCAVLEGEVRACAEGADGRDDAADAG